MNMSEREKKEFLKTIEIRITLALGYYSFFLFKATYQVTGFFLRTEHAAGSSMQRIIVAEVRTQTLYHENTSSNKQCS